MRIYISGPITGVLDFKEKFDAAEKHLKETHPNAEIVNPTVISGLPLTYDEFMDLDFWLLERCEIIYLLKGWELSKGACMEHGYAVAKDMIILKEE